MEKDSKKEPQIQHNSVVTIEKDPRGTYTASWKKYGRELVGKGASDQEALFALVKEVEDVIAIENAKVMEDFTKDEKMQEAAIAQAQEIDNLMQSKWFRIDELASKVKGVSEMQIAESLRSLQAFGLVQAKANPNPKGRPKFKITMTNDARKKVFEQQIEAHKNEIEALSKEIEALG